MTINEGAFIKISYTGSAGSRIFDTTEEAVAKDAGIHSPNAMYGPITICVGQKHVILGLDEELVGKDAGFEADITVPPEKAFGERDSKLVKSFLKNKFKEKPVRGMSVNFGEDGEGIVIDVIGSKVIVDFNSPLAGETLSYHYKVEEIVDTPLDQFKGLVRLYANKDMEIALENGKATVTLPPGTNYDRRWLIWRGRILLEGFELIPGINEITLVETYKRPEKME
ncbi:MAG: peptidylprolyl isomerase [Methanoregula sp.]|nr:peptidylprolyl isomerase [Methanoregula sp.]